jgi:hypothetical protein
VQFGNLSLKKRPRSNPHQILVVLLLALNLRPRLSDSLCSFSVPGLPDFSWCKIPKLVSWKVRNFSYHLRSVADICNQVFYPGESHMAGYSYANMKCYTQVYSWILSCVWKLHPKVQHFILGYNTLYLGTTLYTWEQNSILGYKTLYLGTKLYTWVQNFILGYKTLCVYKKQPFICDSIWKYYTVMYILLIKCFVTIFVHQ